MASAAHHSKQKGFCKNNLTAIYKPRHPPTTDLPLAGTERRLGDELVIKLVPDAGEKLLFDSGDLGWLFKWSVTQAVLQTSGAQAYVDLLR